MRRLESETKCDLYVANCGPALGISYEEIGIAFGRFGEVLRVGAADQTGSRVIVSYSQHTSAQAALQAWDGNPCTLLHDRLLHIRYSTLLQPQPQTQSPHPGHSVSLSALELQVPGIHLLLDFVTDKEEEELLAAVDGRPWKNLAKRRVQHYGYEFLYETRNVDVKDHQGDLPSFVSSLRKRISSFSGIAEVGDIIVDQLTVNEYPPGVGLSPHIDTHSAFEGFIFSLSLAGPCIMEFRKYSQGSCLSPSIQPTGGKGSSPEVTKKSLFLPPRSMLLLSGEGRYAWHHYIPHHKVDAVRGEIVKRASRRVSFTFRKIHTKKRNRLDTERMNKLVYVQFNARLMNKKKRKSDKVDALLVNTAHNAQSWMVDGLEDEEVTPGSGLTWGVVGEHREQMKNCNHEGVLAISKK